MNFTDDYDVIIKNLSNKLNSNYSSMLQRFSVEGNLRDDNSPSTANALDLLCDRVVNVIAKGDTDRIAPRQVIIDLANELNTYVNEPTLKMMQATMFLLGAIIHRIYRIEAEYEARELSSYTPSWFSSIIPKVRDPNACGLYKTLKEALGLTPQQSSGRQQRRPLDVVTIVMSLKIFRANMLKPIPIEIKTTTVLVGEEDAPLSSNKGAATSSTQPKLDPLCRYMRYEHLKQDANFVRNLDDIIKKHEQTEDAQVRLPQFYAIKFIESLTFRVEINRTQFEQILKEWLDKLKIDLPFNDEGEVAILDTLDGFFQKKIELIPLPSECTEGKERQVAEYKRFVYTSLQQQIGARLPFITLKGCANYDELFNALCMENKRNNLRILAGAYTLFRHEKGIQPKLLTEMKSILSLEEDLTAEEEKGCIKCLSTFLEKQALVPLNCIYFGSRDNLNSAIIDLSNELNLTEQKKPQTKPQVSQEETHNEAQRYSFM